MSLDEDEDPDDKAPGMSVIAHARISDAQSSGSRISMKEYLE